MPAASVTRAPKAALPVLPKTAVKPVVRVDAPAKVSAPATPARTPAIVAPPKTAVAPARADSVILAKAQAPALGLYDQRGAIAAVGTGDRKSVV